MSYIGNTPGVSSQRVVLEEVISGSPKSAFTPISGYTLGYLDVLVNGVEVDTADYTATDGVTVTLATAAAVGDTVKIKTWLPRGLSDGYLKSEADAKYVAKAGSTVTGPVIMDTAYQGGLRVLRDYNVTVGGPAGQAIQFGAKQGTTPVYPVEVIGVTDSDGTAYSWEIGFNGTTAMSLTKTKTLNLPFGQIKFPATQNPSSDANTLDDYEEGTWTPTLTSDGTPPTISGYNTRTGSYTKVGNLVTVTCSIRATITSIGSGSATVTGMPFASAGFIEGVALGIRDILSITSPSYAFVSGSAVFFNSGYVTTSNTYLTFTVSYRVA